MIDAAPLPDHSIRGIVDQTLVANTWTFGAPVWDYDLPKGDYVLMSLRFWYFVTTSGSCVCRVLFDDTNWRPGVLGVKSAADKTSLLGIVNESPIAQWPFFPEFHFTNERMPDFEFLSPIANTDLVIEMAVKKVGPGGK